MNGQKEAGEESALNAVVSVKFLLPDKVGVAENC
jgi:hypothetical protein